MAGIGRYKAFLALAAGVALMILSLHFILHRYGIVITPHTVADFLQKARGVHFILPMLCALYMASGFFLFPVTVLNLACAMVFGPIWGVLYGLAGSLSNAVLFFWLGRLFGRLGSVRALLARGRMKAINDRLRHGGVIGVTMIRLVPVAPFALFNLTAGISSIAFAAFIIGTALSLMPGAIARGFLGDSLMRVFLHPDAGTIAYLACGLAFWAAMVYIIHRLVSHFKGARVPSASARPAIHQPEMSLDHGKDTPTPLSANQTRRTFPDPRL